MLRRYLRGHVEVMGNTMGNNEDEDVAQGWEKICVLMMGNVTRFVDGEMVPYN